jgi:hypothetical protein
LALSSHWRPTSDATAGSSTFSSESENEPELVGVVDAEPHGFEDGLVEHGDRLARQDDTSSQDSPAGQAHLGVVDQVHAGPAVREAFRVGK